MTSPAVVDLDGIHPRSRRLSDVTKHLWYPGQKIVGSHWEHIRDDICIEKLGLEFDTWQDGACNLTLAYGEDGFLVHTVGGCGWSLPRQVGKTSTLAGMIFGLCVYIPGLLVIWSAHHSATHEETFLSMQGFAARPRIAPFIEKVYTGSGDEEVRFHNGSRILFGARERGFGRGIPGVDVLINDEGQILSQKAMQNMLATMNTSQFALHVYAGTPPKPGDNSETFAGMRNDAIASIKGDAYVDDIVWIECGADDDADLDDMKQAAKANASFPHRTPLQAFQRLRRRLDDDGYRREALGIWDPDGESIFELDKWSSMKDEDAEAPESAALVIDVSPDQKWSCLGIAGASTGGVPLIMIKSLRGTSKTVEEIKKMRDERSLIDIAITSGAARALETDLVEEGIVYDIMGTSEVAAAYANFQKAVKDEDFIHLGQAEFNIAIEMAKSRTLNVGEGTVFDRRGQSVDVSPAIAGAGALYRWGLAANAMPLIM